MYVGEKYFIHLHCHTTLPFDSQFHIFRTSISYLYRDGYPIHDESYIL